MMLHLRSMRALHESVVCAHVGMCLRSNGYEPAARGDCLLSRRKTRSVATTLKALSAAIVTMTTGPTACPTAYHTRRSMYAACNTASPVY
eukprot:240441-Pleurochrysis_carterae.AAC.2